MKRTEFDTALGQEVLRVCTNNGITCAVGPIVSTCGSIISQFDITGPDTAETILSNEIDANGLPVPFDGATLTATDMFPITRTLRVNYTGSLSSITPTAADIAALIDAFTTKSSLPDGASGFVVEQVSDGVFSIKFTLASASPAEYYRQSVSQGTLDTQAADGSLDLEFKSQTLAAIPPSSLLTTTAPKTDDSNDDKASLYIGFAVAIGVRSARSC